MWAQTVGDIARARAPVRRGYLKSTIYARIKGWVAEVGAEASYAVFVEFGTRYMRARPFLYPAIQSYLPVLEQIILEAIDMAKMEAGL
jgi:HK97 gp10 family phage protein